MVGDEVSLEFIPNSANGKKHWVLNDGDGVPRNFDGRQIDLPKIVEKMGKEWFKKENEKLKENIEVLERRLQQRQHFQRTLQRIVEKARAKIQEEKEKSAELENALKVEREKNAALEKTNEEQKGIIRCLEENLEKKESPFSTPRPEPPEESPDFDTESWGLCPQFHEAGRD